MLHCVASSRATRTMRLAGRRPRLSHLQLVPGMQPRRRANPGATVSACRPWMTFHRLLSANTGQSRVKPTAGQRYRSWTRFHRMRPNHQPPRQAFCGASRAPVWVAAIHLRRLSQGRMIPTIGWGRNLLRITLICLCFSDAKSASRVACGWGEA